MNDFPITINVDISVPVTEIDAGQEANAFGNWCQEQDVKPRIVEACFYWECVITFKDIMDGFDSQDEALAACQSVTKTLIAEWKTLEPKPDCT